MLNLKTRVAKRLPKAIRKTLKNFYYDKIIYPLYQAKYLIRYGRRDFFSSIAIETTTYCNLRCKFCPNGKYERGTIKNRKFMDLNLFNKIINDLKKINYQEQILLHFYGEPLSDPRLPGLVKHVRHELPKVEIQINTNGFLLTPELYSRLVNAGVDRFAITQYGKIMPPSIKNVLEYIQEKNIENKIDYRVFGEDVGISNRGGEIDIECPVDYERPICLYPKTAIHVDYLGNIVLCCNDYHSSIKHGNLADNDLIKIWESKKYKQLRKDLRMKKFVLPICKRCVGIR